uniref:TBC1 domain family member 25 n=1 Tax=Lonchura striata TaxID=40157 RepID=UPI001293CC94
PLCPLRKKSFVLSFAAHNGQGQDTFVPLLSDGDLANAFSCARPALRLRLDVRNGPESPLLEDWDIISPREVAAAEPVPERRSLLAAALPFTQALLAQHLRLKAAEYSSLKAALAARAAPAELAQVAAAVRKDVVRTDRAHPYFGGPEEGHPHLAALQALLTTFALGHPRLSYCQGMSDVAAPLLAVLDDEAQAFVCFCSLMRRLAPRFRPGGRGLARAFAHLRRLLRRADPPFWAFLAARGAHDLLFCYRWLLLELKREFAFDDALKVLEITWSSLPPAPPPPPEGVPLLGAPLGARGAGRALRERRGLRPRPPRRRRRRRSVEEEERAGGLAEGSGGGFGGLKASSDGPEGPKSSGDVPNSHKISSELFESPKSFSDVLEGSEGSQEDPKSSSDVPNRLGDSQKGPKIFKNVQEGLESSSDVPKGHKSSRKVQGRSPRDAGGAPEGSKDSEPGGPRKVEEGTDALEIDQRPHSLCWGAGEDPREGQDDRREGHDPGEGRGGPKEGPDDPREEPADPGMNRGDPREGDDDLGEGHNIGEGHNSPKDVRHDPRDGHRGFRDGRGDPKEGCDDPRRGRDDLKDDHRDLKPNHDDPEEGRDDTKHGHDDLEDDHRATDNPKSPEDPWGGRWAWEEPSSSSSSSSSCSSGSSSSDEEVTVEDDGAPLPPPEELGQGNPFLLFVCLAMLLEQREAVMARAGDYNEVAMHFDRLVRRHHLPRVLRRAKALFARYLEGWGATAPGGPQTGPPSGQGVTSGAPTG